MEIPEEDAEGGLSLTQVPNKQHLIQFVSITYFRCTNMEDCLFVVQTERV